MLILFILTPVVVFAFYYFLIKPMRYWKDRGVAQTDPWIFFGDSWKTLFRVSNLMEMVQDIYNKYPNARYTGFYQFSRPTLLLKDLELVKKVLVKDFNHFADHLTLKKEDVDPLLAKNLVALKGQKWHDMRSALSPSFTASKMRLMFVLISECAENFVQHFIKKNENIVTIEMKEVFTRFTNDVIATTAFGVKVDSLNEPHNEFYTMGRNATDFSNIWKILKLSAYILVPKLCRKLGMKLFSGEMDTFFRQLIDETIKVREEKGIVRPDMIHMLMEARKGTESKNENDIIDEAFSSSKKTYTAAKENSAKNITNEDITAQALIFFFAGFETVATLMCFMAHELAVNPDIQQKLRAEIRSTFDDYKNELTYDAILKMKYMDMIVSESLRKWPVGALTDRVCTKPYTIEPVTPEERPLHIEKGQQLWIPVFPIHRNPEYYPDPERFLPERFSDENKENIKPYTYLPFGLGPRNCIGFRFALLEIKVIFFHILLNFEIMPVEKTQIPLQISRKSFSMAPDGGFWLGLKHIKM